MDQIDFLYHFDSFFLCILIAAPSTRFRPQADGTRIGLRRMKERASSPVYDRGPGVARRPRAAIRTRRWRERNRLNDDIDEVSAVVIRLNRKQGRDRGRHQVFEALEKHGLLGRQQRFLDEDRRQRAGLGHDRHGNLDLFHHDVLSLDHR